MESHFRFEERKLLGVLETLEETQTQSRGSFAVPCDVSDPESVEALFDAVVGRTGRVDLLVNNAGTFGLSAPVGEYSPDAWAAFQTDVKAKCLAAAQTQGMKSPEVIVHPVGTEAYGIAVLREGADKRICVYGKQSKKVELTPAT